MVVERRLRTLIKLVIVTWVEGLVETIQAWRVVETLVYRALITSRVVMATIR